MLFLANDLQASRVNLLMNDFAGGLPSPLAFLGLGEAIGRYLGAAHWNVGVLPVLHRVDVSEGRTKAEAAPSRKSGIFAPIEIAEDLIGSVTVSLLLDIPDVSDEHRVGEALVGRRVAGGPIENSHISATSVPADGSCLRKLTRGYAMIRTTAPKSAVIGTGAIGELQAVASQLYTTERGPGTGWLVPVAVGHRLLEDPNSVPKRANTRDPAIPHVFAEPVIGIAELVSVRSKRLIETSANGFPDLFWRWQAEGQWIVGHRNYHPNHHAAG